MLEEFRRYYPSRISVVVSFQLLQVLLFLSVLTSQYHVCRSTQGLSVFADALMGMTSFSAAQWLKKWKTELAPHGTI